MALHLLTGRRYLGLEETGLGGVILVRGRDRCAERSAEASKEVAYLRRFLEELGLGSDDPTSLATDNSAAQSLSYNPEHHERTKHIERRHFFVRDLVEDGQLASGVDRGRWYSHLFPQ